MSTVILLLLLVGTVLWLLLWALGFFKPITGGPFVPNSAPAGNWTSRIAEAIVLACAGTAILVFTATNRSNGGLLLMLDKLRPEFATTNLIVAICAAAGTLLAFLICLFFRTSFGAILMATVLCAYSWMLNGQGRVIEQIAPRDSYEPIVNYTFEVRDESSIQGADIWVNNVYLGKTPVNITRRQFREKVPYLEQPPAGYTDEQKRRLGDHWFRFKFLELNKRDRWYGTWPYKSDFKDYYVRAKLGDEWGQSIHGGTGGGTSGYRRADYTVSLYVYFPSRGKIINERQNRFQTLLQKARLRGYQVESAWFKAMATYGEAGWMKLRKLTLKEKEFSEVVDKWVKWKYGFGKDINQEKAREVFQQICDEADARRRYNSAGPAGKAVEMIFDKLDIEQLVDIYEWAVKSGRPMYSSRGGKEISESLASSHFWSNHEQSEHHRKKVLPGSISVIVHAIRLWDAKLNAESHRKPNIIEERISPAMLVWHDSLSFGGPVVERYLLRQYARESRIEGINLGYKDQKFHFGLNLNRWLYSLAHLDSPAGRDFRKRYRQQVLALADLLVESSFNHDKKFPEFLFLDPDQGKNSIAYEYWPKYCAAVESSSYLWDDKKLKRKWAYLAGLGSSATVDMNMDCWRQVTDLHELMGGNHLVEAVEAIPEEMRIQVARAILAELERRIAAKRNRITSEKQATAFFDEHDYVWALKRHLGGIGDEESLRWWVSKLKRRPYNDERDRVVRILEGEKGPGHPLVKVLAREKNPELRLLVMGTLRNYPISENRDILNQLLNDPDEEVHKAAEQVAAELRAIEDMPFQRLVSQPAVKEAPR